MDADTRELLAGSIRELLKSPGELVAGLAEMGWAEVVSDDEAAATELLFTEQGRAGAASAALDGVMIDAALASGPVVVVHPFGAATSTCIGDEVHVDGVLLAEPASGASYVVIVGDVVYIVPVESDSATLVNGFDPASRLRRVRLSAGAVRRQTGDGVAATAAARRALASELIGNGRAMLDLAVDQVTQRHQFGRPIGANQTPRHRLADAYVQLSAAGELVQIAWASGTPWDATVAKAYAGQAVDTTARACLQVCGAIGLTAEHPLGNYVKRSRTLDALHGRWQHAMRAIGEELLAARTIPQGVRV
ncbi:acyl-CoA dehydrogenase family protein [Mycolicibacterium sp.]|uniref:acyl-CoA dehydrogenase family protein n=1 Tax=Mycolicibacterium sp. TaxID=2320850 RepID=UPI001A331A28|nr:acyl-CoA dehydrogenase family protein [Mycolicibacterium sp.]MBJ7336408.1 acyl-CoA dehydrogenase [Mycolicibacterium sp.]